jgi:hypothetical protein
MHHLPDIYTMVATKLASPTNQQLNYPSRHDPFYIKKSENRYPQNYSYFAMEQKMVDGFPAFLAHATPVHHYDMLLPKVIQSQNLP